MTESKPDTPDNACDVCMGQSPDSQYVGVAAVPAAPVSVAWCQNCLRNNAIPLFVVETWLFTEFDDREGAPIPMPDERPDFPMADWAGEMTIWRGKQNAYVKIKDAWPELWEEERARHTASDS
jgi:hypothetical protein